MVGGGNARCTKKRRREQSTSSNSSSTIVDMSTQDDGSGGSIRSRQDLTTAIHHGHHPRAQTFEAIVELPPKGKMVGLSYTGGGFPRITNAIPNSCFHVAIGPLLARNDTDIRVRHIHGRDCDQTSDYKSKFRDTLQELQLEGRVNPVKVVFDVQGPSLTEGTLSCSCSSEIEGGKDVNSLIGHRRPPESPTSADEKMDATSHGASPETTPLAGTSSWRPGIKGANPQEDAPGFRNEVTGMAAERCHWVVLTKWVPNKGAGGVRLLPPDVIKRIIDTLSAEQNAKESEFANILRVELKSYSRPNEGIRKEWGRLIVASKIPSLAQRALDMLGRHITNALLLEKMRAMLLSKSCVEVTIDFTKEMERQREGGHFTGGAPDRSLGCCLHSISGETSGLKTFCGVLIGKPRPGSVFDAVVGQEIFSRGPLVLMIRVNGYKVSTPDDVICRWKEGKGSPSHGKLTLCLCSSAVTLVKKPECILTVVPAEGLTHRP